MWTKLCNLLEVAILVYRLVLSVSWCKRKMPQIHAFGFTAVENFFIVHWGPTQEYLPQVENCRSFSQWWLCNVDREACSYKHCGWFNMIITLADSCTWNKQWSGTPYLHSAVSMQSELTISRARVNYTTYHTKMALFASAINKLLSALVSILSTDARWLVQPCYELR